jgi:hypothetical protein
MRLAYSIPSDEKEHVVCERSFEVFAATAFEQRRRAVNVRAPRRQCLYTNVIVYLKSSVKETDGR